MTQFIKTCLCGLLFLSLTAATSQREYKLNLGGKTLVFTEVNKVTIEGYSGSEVVIETTTKEKEKEDRAEGLRAINALGLSDNTGIGLSVTEDGDQFEVRIVSANEKGEYVVRVPNGTSIRCEQSSVYGKGIHVQNFNGELDISLNYGSVSLDNVQGAIAINAVYGNIEASFSQVSADDPISLHSVYGHVDVTIPASAAADVRLATSYGEMFTDFDIEIDRTGSMTRISSKNVVGKINGGGPDINLKATYDNIYLRKS